MWGISLCKRYRGMRRRWRDAQGHRPALRPPREQDKLDRLSCGRNAEYIRMVGGDHRHLPPLTAEQVERWYQRLLAEPLERVIDLGGRCIGRARLHSLNEQDRHPAG